jgi:hypothetical protein
LHPGHLGQSPPSSAHCAARYRWYGWNPSCWRKTGPLVGKWHKHITGKEEKPELPIPSSIQKERTRTHWPQRLCTDHILWLYDWDTNTLWFIISLRNNSNEYLVHYS